MTTQLATGTRFDGRRAQARVEAQTVETFVDGVLGETLHEMRVKSLALATVGVLHSSSLAIHMIGRGLAAARGTSAKHGTKQVDRLLSNGGIELWRLLELWVRFVVGVREEIIVALDWTEFDADKQATICLYMIMRQGRATPLIWKTVSTKTIAGKRNEYEYDVVGHLHEAQPCLCAQISSQTAGASRSMPWGSAARTKYTREGPQRLPRSLSSLGVRRGGEHRTR